MCSESNYRDRNRKTFSSLIGPCKKKRNLVYPVFFFFLMPERNIPKRFLTCYMIWKPSREMNHLVCVGLKKRGFVQSSETVCSGVKTNKGGSSKARETRSVSTLSLMTGTLLTIGVRRTSSTQDLTLPFRMKTKTTRASWSHLLGFQV